MTSIKYSISLFMLILLSTTAFSGNNDVLFPKPVELERDVECWVSVFTKYSTEEGVLHDNRNLAVVYETTPMPSNISRRERNRRAQKRRTHYQAILRTLATGKRDNLSDEEQRVLDLWPDIVGVQQ